MSVEFGPASARVRERHLWYGPPFSGKSNAALTWMRRYGGHFHVIDGDDAWDFMLYEDEESNAKLLERGNFTIHNVDYTNWTEQFETVQKIATLVQPGDVVVYDKVTESWAAVQDWYTHEIFEKGYSEYAVEMRRALEEDRSKARSEKQREKRTQPLFDQFRDWGVINPEYKKLYAELYRINRVAHVVLVADAGSIGDNDDEDLRKLCRPFGAKPKGQNGLLGFAHTVLHFGLDRRAGNTTWEVSTVKDRARRTEKALDEEPWDDITKTYLGPVAGWKMQKVD